MPDKVRRTKCKLPAIDCAYQAILKIGFIDWRFYGEHGPALERCQEISNNALRHLNSEHTVEIQKSVFKLKVRSG
jgi:hypothetical protein